jgi:Putative collagen-binding domain of a collagenase
MWDQSRYALDFFANIPFWRMSNADALVSGKGRCLAEVPNYSYVVVYLPEGGSVEVDLSAVGSGNGYSVKWFNPRRGGDLVDGSVTDVVTSTGPVSLGLPPSEHSDDWAVLLRCIDCPFLDLGPGPMDGPAEVPVSVPSLQVSPVAATTETTTGTHVANPVAQSPRVTPPAPTLAVSEPTIEQNDESSSRNRITGLLTIIVAQLWIVAVL